jgi:phosphatidylglycerophosphate synthase
MTDTSTIRGLEQLHATLDMLRQSQETIGRWPALVSWARIVILPLCIYQGIHGSYRSMFWLVLLAASTDYLDGWLARRLRRCSTPGKTLDFLADKLFLSVMLIFLSRLGAINPILAGIPAWYHILLVLGLLVVSWSIKMPVVAITTSERLTVILSYLLVAATSGALAFHDKTIFAKLSWITSFLTPFAAVLGVISYFRLSRRLIQRYIT